MADRKHFVRQLQEAAALLAVLGEDERSRAYSAGARALEAFEGDFAKWLAEGGSRRIRGIGPALAAALRDAPADGLLPLLEELRSRVPAGVRELFRVPGLGAGKIRALWAAGIDSPTALIEGVESGRVQALRGFGAKSAAQAAAGAKFVLASDAFMRRDEAEAIAAAVEADLVAACPGATVWPAGALRRGLETPDRVDLVVVRSTLEEVAAFAERALDAGSPESLGPAGAHVVEGHVAGRPVSLTWAPRLAAGAVHVEQTGSEAFVAALRARAAGAGLALEPDGLFHGRSLVSTPTEEDVFAALGAPYVPPELRETADAEPVEGLIELADVRGLVHNHTTWSDAEHSIRQMVAAARAAGFAYLALADHSRSSFYANGLSEDRVRRQADEVRSVRDELRAEGSDFGLIHGIEVDILPDGSLDYGDDVLALLDYTVVSVHQQFALSRADQTARIVAAVQHPHADILGHPTGRLLLRRPGYDVDLDAVVDACATAGTVIEINANPRRLELDWRWAREARLRGCRFSIDPDAHGVEAFDHLRHGVAVARKAGLRRSDVVNTASSAEAFLGRLKRGGRSA